MRAIQPRLMKRANEALVREALSVRGRASKAELARDTGLSLTTVGQVLAAMEADGELRLRGFNESSGGRKAAAYELNPDACVVYAVAVERDRLDWAIANALGTVVADGTRIVRRDPVEDAVNLVLTLKEDPIGGRRPSRGALALGLPGAVQGGRVLTGFLEERWRDADIELFFMERTGLPVVAENDMNAAALGFARRSESEGRPVHSIVYLFTTGDCTGSGIVCGGQVLRGAFNFAGELGLMPVRPGATFEEALAEAAGPAEYAAVYAGALAALNCVINPALVVVGGPSFRYDLSDAVAAEFAIRVDAAVRPALVFERETRPHYLYGLCGLGTEELFPSFRIIDKRS